MGRWWVGAMTAAVLVGLVAIGVARTNNEPSSTEAPGRPPEEAEPPTVGDHWHVAYGFYVCDGFAPALSDNGRDEHGIHSHGDGIIHVHPFSSEATGERAVLGVFEEGIGIELEDGRIDLGTREYRNGRDTCGGKEAEVRVFVDGQPYEGDPSDIKLEDRRLIVVAFAPPDAQVPAMPPSAPTLDNLSDVAPS